MKSRKNSPVIADTLFQQHIVFGSEEYSGTADTKGMALCRRICGNLPPDIWRRRNGRAEYDVRQLLFVFTIIDFY